MENITFYLIKKSNQNWTIFTNGSSDVICQASSTSSKSVLNKM